LPGRHGDLRPSYRIIDGFRMPLGFPPDGLLSARQYIPRSDDIFVASYPKCGTTWTQYIVYMLVRGHSVSAGESLGELFPHLEEVGREMVEALPLPRLIKTHLPLPMAPFSPAAKFIYVARNPFDCAVSFYHHTRGFERHYRFSAGEFDEFFEVFIRGQVDFGDYFAHLLSWIAVSEDANVHFTTYERLKRDLDAEIVALGDFLGGDAARAARDPAARANIVDATSFKHMSLDQSRWASPRPEDMPAFVRKGVVGDWANHFDAEQLRRLLLRVERELRGTALLDEWSHILDDVRSHTDSSVRT
jgi:sulfotransferase